MVKNITIWSFLEPLLYSQEFMHLAEISRKLKLPHTTIRKYLNSFEKQGILIKKYQGRLTMYKLNYNNPLIIDYISLVEKERLVKKCKDDLIIKEVVSFFHENLKNKTLIFGSAINNVKKANDLDIVIIGKIEEKIKNLEKKLGIKFHIIKLDKLEDINETLKNEIKEKHLIINHTEEFIRWMLKN